MPQEHVHPAATEVLRQLQRDRHVLPELPLPLRIAHEPPVPRSHVSGVEVEERDREASPPDRPLYLAEVLARRPPELDGRETRIPDPSEPLRSATSWNSNETLTLNLILRSSPLYSHPRLYY